MAIGAAIGTASLFLNTRRRGRATAKTSAEQQAEVAVIVNRASPTKKKQLYKDGRLYQTLRCRPGRENDAVPKPRGETTAEVAMNVNQASSTKKKAVPRWSIVPDASLQAREGK